MGHVINTTGRSYVGTPYITVRTQVGATYLVRRPPAATPNYYLDTTTISCTPLIGQGRRLERHPGFTPEGEDPSELTPEHDPPLIIAALVMWTQGTNGRMLVDVDPFHRMAKRAKEATKTFNLKLVKRTNGHRDNSSPLGSLGEVITHQDQTSSLGRCRPRGGL